MVISEMEVSQVEKVMFEVKFRLKKVSVGFYSRLGFDVKCYFFN